MSKKQIVMVVLLTLKNVIVELQKLANNLKKEL